VSPRVPIPTVEVPTTAPRRLRRVFIEDRQQKTLEHARARGGYAKDVSPDAHDDATFRLINQRKELDELPDADFVIPALDEWKHWMKMNDWDSRNNRLEDLIRKLRRREASTGEIQLLVVVCRPAWAAVMRSLRRYGGSDLDAGARKAFGREEIARVNTLDRAELDQVVHHALVDALLACPSPFPRRFFPWLKKVLLYRVLDHVRQDLEQHVVSLPHDDGIRKVLDQVLVDDSRPSASYFRAVGAPGHSQWIRTLDLQAIFDLADEYAPYARTRTACERAVSKLPPRQRQVVQDHYFNAMTKAQIAEVRGLATSSVRNSHAGAIRTLRKDDELFDVLEAVGKVRDEARRKLLRPVAQDAA
jgi:RNA polymerase sigma factor (sigma-70 family)